MSVYVCGSSIYTFLLVPTLSHGSHYDGPHIITCLLIVYHVAPIAVWECTGAPASTQNALAFVKINLIHRFLFTFSNVRVYRRVLQFPSRMKDHPVHYGNKCICSNG